MSWPRILVYYALAVLLTFHLTGIVRDREAAVETAEPASAPFLEAVPERIDRVRLENESMAVQLERRDGRWIVTEPEGLAPPGDVIDAVLESFTSLPAIETVSDGVEHQGQFGLVPPRARIRIEQQGTLVSTIVLGELSPTRTAVYAKKSGSEEVALIGLNAKYYIDLVFENVRRQRESTGVPVPDGDERAPEPARDLLQGGPDAEPQAPAPAATPPAATPPGAPPPAAEPQQGR